MHAFNSLLAVTVALVLAGASNVSAFSGEGTFYEPEKSNDGQVSCNNDIFNVGRSIRGYSEE